MIDTWFIHDIKKVLDEKQILVFVDPSGEAEFAKMSIGSGSSYWMNLANKGSSEIFDLNQMLLPFLDNPHRFMSIMDQATSLMFVKSVCESI